MQCVWKEFQETWVVILALADISNQVNDFISSIFISD